MKIAPYITVRIPDSIYKEILTDLERPHAIAYERVGFITSSTERLGENEYVVLVTGYYPVADEHYKKDRSVGAHIDINAITVALQRVIGDNSGTFHTHSHYGYGIPEFSTTDINGLTRMVESFCVDSQQAHGLMLLNSTSVNCKVWLPGEKPAYAQKIVVVGNPMKFSFPRKSKLLYEGERHKRQTFLGEDSEFLIQNMKVGIVGLGGGGSHIVQQLSHIGFLKYNVFDDDIVEESNLNRLIGAVYDDVKKKTNKVNVAERVIKSILPNATPTLIKDKWQNKPDKLHECDIVIGCVDSLKERSELEVECRRYHIPLIDIGMDVIHAKEFFIRGQIILSMPSCHCMRCFHYLNDENLSEEAAKYGAVGGKPQVVWPNGVLASIAVGLLMEMVTGWSENITRSRYLSYDGNTHAVQPHVQEEFPIFKECPHYPLIKAGPPKWKKLSDINH